MTSRKKESILVVDDAVDTLDVIQRNLITKNYRVITTSSVEKAIAILNKESIDLVITDLKMPKVSGLKLVRHVRENCKETEVMMITGFATPAGAVEAIKTGAQEYLSKPFTDKELFTAVAEVLEKLRIRRATQKQEHDLHPFKYGIIGKSKAMQKVYSDIEKVACAPITVFISGESGTGKELVARAIHYSSSRASAPFVCVNCGGIPEGLLESELFGHMKGAFSGAHEARAGFFQTADGGTIFLDEIGDTSLAMQGKLLRVLQEKEIYMVGNYHPQKVDVRILAATNKNLNTLIKKEKFREDLFFRLNAITISLPPLRERGDDILELIPYFLSKFAKELDKPIPHFSDNSLEVLRNYFWPGNVRELENMIQALVVMTENSTIEVSDLPAFMRFSALPKGGLNRTLAEVEAECIRNVLANVSGNKSKAAKILGIDRKTLRNKIDLYKISSIV